MSDSDPLLAAEDGARKRQMYTRATKSYDRAVSQPWTGHHGAGNLPWWKTPSVFWLLPAFFPFCVAFGGLMVPRTYLILNLLCKEYLDEKASKDPNFRFNPVIPGMGENEQCRDYHVQQRNALFNTYTDLLAGLFAAIVTPHLGALSDRIGRKKVLLLTSIGGLAQEIITIIVGRDFGAVSVWWLLMGSLADGLFGSFTSNMAVAFAYASDVSAPEKRGVSFGYIMATLFMGMSLGPMTASYLIKATGSVMVVFYAALGCHLFYMLFIWILVPESLSKERQMIAREKRAVVKAGTADHTWLQVLKKYNPFEPLWVLRPRGEGSSPALRKNLLVLAAIDTMMFGVMMGTMRIILIYAEYRFGWDIMSSSVFLTVNNVCRTVGLLVLLPLLIRIFRGPSKAESAGHRGSDKLDLGIIRMSIVFDFLGYLGYALAPAGSVMVMSGVIASIGGIGSPTISSSITKHIPADRTGQVLGASGLLHALARVLSPVIFNLIYGMTVGIYAGIVFLCLASVFVIVFILSWLLKPNVYLHESVHSENDEASSQDDSALH